MKPLLNAEDIQPVDLTTEYHLVISARPFGSVLSEYPITDMTIKDNGKAGTPAIRDYAVRYEGAGGMLIKKGTSVGHNRKLGIQKLASIILNKGLDTSKHMMADDVMPGYQLSLVHEA